MTDTRTPAERVQSAEIRAWARDNGWPGLGPRGKIPDAAKARFEEAHGAPLDLDPDDVSEMDETDLDEDVEGERYDGQDGEVTDYEPPASLDEVRQRVGPKPGSAHLRRGRPPKEPKPPKEPVKVTRAVRADIEGKVAFWLLIPGEPWRRVDPYCGQAYLDSIEDIAVKATPLLCQSPAVVRWFAKSTTFVQVTELLMACRPVAEAVIAHHVTRRITLDSNGDAVEVRDGGMDFAAYSARQPNPAAA